MSLCVCVRASTGVFAFVWKCMLMCVCAYCICIDVWWLCVCVFRWCRWAPCCVLFYWLYMSLIFEFICWCFSWHAGWRSCDVWLHVWCVVLKLLVVLSGSCLLPACRYGSVICMCGMYWRVITVNTCHSSTGSMIIRPSLALVSRVASGRVRGPVGPPCLFIVYLWRLVWTVSISRLAGRH